MPGYDKIYLIGFMGSGKSTLGRDLARKLGWSFMDMDKKIEEKTGKTIPQIFDIHGEEWFRKAESETLRNLEAQSGIVVSTGGGVPCHGDNMDFMLKTGLTVYLKMTPGQLTVRLSNSSTERPLLKGLTGEALTDYIKNKLAEREKWYDRAEIIIESLKTKNANLLPVLKKYLKN